MFSEDFSDNDQDDGNSSCSEEDELENFIKEKFDLRNECEDSDDDFEAEMENQLQSRMKFLEQTTILKKAPLSVAESIRSTTPKKAPKKHDVILYDQDSDDSDNQNPETTKGQPSNDDLLYDPDEDDNHQAWIDNQRQAYLRPAGCEALHGKKLNSSDAALNCPGCMTLLCMDCQRHEVYQTQYRAMFVVNCEVDMKDTIEPRESASSRKRRRARNGARLDIGEETYHPVKCTVCGTEVAAFDADEVYHFYNIIASHT